MLIVQKRNALSNIVKSRDRPSSREIQLPTRTDDLISLHGRHPWGRGRFSEGREYLVGNLGRQNPLCFRKSIKCFLFSIKLNNLIFHRWWKTRESTSTSAPIKYTSCMDTPGGLREYQCPSLYDQQRAPWAWCVLPFSPCLLQCNLVIFA